MASMDLISALDLQSPMRHAKSVVSVSSTCAGDSSSESGYSFDDDMTDTKIVSTQNLEADEDYYSHDRSDMPSTRENSPEPTWHLPNQGLNLDYLADQYRAFGGNHNYLPTQPSVEPMWGNAARPFPRTTSPREAHMQQPEPFKTVLVLPADQPVVFVQRDQGANVMIPMNNGGVMPFPVHTTPTQPVPTDVMTNYSEPEEMEQTAAPQLKPKSKNRGYLKNDVFSKMSAEQKDALCKYIYEFMVKKNFVNQEGYLVVDVFSEVWKEMGDTGEGWRVAQARFGQLLRSAPQYFRLFRRGIRVANQCGWFARKGEKMVRVVLPKEM